MKKNHNHQILERIIVPGSKKNNQIVTELIERTSDLQIRNVKYRARTLPGFFLDLENYKTFANSILDDPDRFRGIKIFSYDNKGFHLLESKDFRLITKRSSKKLDQRLKKTLKEIKDHIIENKNVS